MTDAVATDEVKIIVQPDSAHSHGLRSRSAKEYLRSEDVEVSHMCSNVHNPLGTAEYSTSYTKWNINTVTQ